MTLPEALGICLGWEQLIYFIGPFVAAHGLSHKSHAIDVIPQWPRGGVFIRKDKLSARRAAALPVPDLTAV